MRIKLTLRQAKPDQYISINYQYAVSSFIYHTIETSSREYSDWLHEKGFASGNKKFKLFTFSMFNIPKRNIESNRIKILSDEIELTVSMISDKAIEHFIIGMFENQRMRIFDTEYNAEFLIKTVEMIPEPDFSGRVNFKTISPIVLTKRTIYKGKESAYYMSPEDEDYSLYFISNLTEKYKSYNGGEVNGKKINSFTYNGDCISKMIRLKENKDEYTDVRGYVFRFSLEGDRDLIKFGYEAGFGKQCSMGFGCTSANY